MTRRMRAATPPTTPPTMPPTETVVEEVAGSDDSGCIEGADAEPVEGKEELDVELESIIVSKPASLDRTLVLVRDSWVLGKGSGKFVVPSVEEVIVVAAGGLSPTTKLPCSMSRLKRTTGGSGCDESASVTKVRVCWPEGSSSATRGTTICCSSPGLWVPELSRKGKKGLDSPPSMVNSAREDDLNWDGTSEPSPRPSHQILEPARVCSAFDIENRPIERELLTCEA
jgi:hypothetical protein